MHTPWHLWVVGVLTLLFNAMGGFDYIATQYGLDFYMSQFTPEQVEWFNSFPAWVEGAWALAVWSAVAGSLFLLMRSMWAGVAFAIALIAMIATAVHNFVLAEVTMPEVVGDEAIWFSLVIFAVTLVSWLYARQMRKRGVLE